MSSLELAQRLVARGWAVFPCKYGLKVPATINGFLDASTSPERVARWFSTSKNIGVRTGKASGVCVIDVDSYKEGCENTLDQLQDVLGVIPPTYSVRTRAGGVHLYFKMPDVALSSSSSQIGKGIDLRAEGGYVISEGCFVDEDKNGPAGVYEPLNSLPVAPLPTGWKLRWMRLTAEQDARRAKRKPKSSVI